MKRPLNYFKFEERVSGVQSDGNYVVKTYPGTAVRVAVSGGLFGSVTLKL